MNTLEIQRRFSRKLSLLEQIKKQNHLAELPKKAYAKILEK